ncbi:hypothetical protein, partial [Vacuolonema iberomarrocanum]|uniref:hypothetical protein n=1 Tax=Vacuolonema iberomarrocanum TaxID=3454632 RepID=UPI003F6DE519
MTTFMVLFGLFFGIAELFPWLAQFSSAPPIFIGAGILLAIASNLNQAAGLPWQSAEASRKTSLAKPTTPAVPATSKPSSASAPATPSPSPTPRQIQR